MEDAGGGVRCRAAHRRRVGAAQELTAGRTHYATDSGRTLRRGCGYGARGVATARQGGVAALAADAARKCQFLAAVCGACRGCHHAGGGAIVQAAADAAVNGDARDAAGTDGGIHCRLVALGGNAHLAVAVRQGGAVGKARDAARINRQVGFALRGCDAEVDAARHGEALHSGARCKSKEPLVDSAAAGVEARSRIVNVEPFHGVVVAFEYSLIRIIEAFPYRLPALALAVGADGGAAQGAQVDVCHEAGVALAGF